MTTLVCMTGCEKKQENKVAMGHYVEQEIALPEGTITVNQTDDGKILAAQEIEEGIINIYSLDEDYIWKEDRQVEIQSEHKMLLDTLIDSEGVYLLYATSDNQVGVSEQLYNGTKYEVLLSDEEGICKVKADGYYTLAKALEGKSYI